MDLLDTLQPKTPPVPLNARLVTFGVDVERSSKFKHMIKLDETLVAQIKALLRNEVSVRQVARRFDVAPGTISDIKSGRCWGHVK